MKTMYQSTLNPSVFEPPPQPNDPTLSLDQFEGEWTKETAGHLLRRTTMAPLPNEIMEAESLGLEETLNRLFAEAPMPEPPVNYYFEEDPYVPIGETWIHQPISKEVNLVGHRRRSLKAWAVLNWMEEGISIREKMVMFWHNHFAVSLKPVSDPTFIYDYEKLIRENATGNFRDLVKKMTIHPAMLRFLNGNQNTNKAPNENYARELLELYTVGKGALAGPGDYTTFTEQDVVEIARVLTGWKDRGYNKKESDINFESYFREDKHDEGLKQLSNRLGNAIITNLGENEYDYLVDVIFEQRNAATYVCEKLYRWFVYYDITDEIRQNIIEPLADILISSDFEVEPVLRTLLSSNHFFDVLNWGPMIKNPVDYVISMLKQTFTVLPETLNERYFLALKMYDRMRFMEMDYFAPPDVAGWSPYYKAPAYYRIWINATTITARMSDAGRLARNRFRFSGLNVVSNPIKILDHVEDALNPNEVVRGFAQTLLPMPLTEGQYTALKDILIPGLPDFEWTVEYGMFLEDPENEDLAKSIDRKIRDLTEVMLNMAEFHLS